MVKLDPQRYAPHEMRLAILKRDKYRCHYCKAQVTLEDANIDHQKPWKLGGKTILSNLVTACQPCNKEKGNSLHFKKKSAQPSPQLAKTILYYKLVRSCEHPTSPFCILKSCIEQSGAIPFSKKQKLYRAAARWIQQKQRNRPPPLSQAEIQQGKEFWKHYRKPSLSSLKRR